ncbi:MAG TPA: MDR family MFS transporter [Pseudonocardiaceae bacterium]|nr:MDR family MFS transporter [Pseudonocardiaceae bacterium]
MTTTRTQPAELAELAGRAQRKREIYAVMSGLMIAMLLAMLDNLIVGTAMPTIVGELGGLAHLSWVVTGYALATAVSTPVWAKLGDLYGRKGVFMASIVVFLIGSSLAGLSQGMGELIAFRGVQGLGAGGLMVGAMAIIGDLIPLRERGRYQGLMAAVMPVAFIGGPLLGGLLTDHLSWRWAFYINLPLGVLALLVTAMTMHLPGRRGQVSVDWSGAGLLAVGVAALTLLASWGGTEYDWVSAPILGLGVLSALALGAFVAVERRVTEPILPLRLFTRRNFTAAVVLTFLTGLAMFGAVTFLPQFQQIVQGASATSSGLQLLPLMGGMLVTSLLGGQLVSRTGRYRGLLLAGSGLMSAGLGLMATMDLGTGQLTTSLWMVVLGVGMGMLMQTTLLVVQNSVGQPDLGAATGAATLFRTIGGSLGVSVFGTLFAQQLHAGLPGAGAPSRLTPAMLAGLPAAIRHSYQQAVATGVDQVFRWAALIALLAVVAAWLIGEVPLRGLAGQPQPLGTERAARRQPAHRFDGGPDQWLVAARSHQLNHGDVTD